MARTAKQQAALKKAQKASAMKRSSASSKSAPMMSHDAPGKGNISLSAGEVAKRKKERPFDLAYQAGQVSRVSRGAESGTRIGKSTSAQSLARQRGY